MVAPLKKEAAAKFLATADPKFRWVSGFQESGVCQNMFCITTRMMTPIGTATIDAIFSCRSDESNKKRDNLFLIIHLRL